MARMRPSTPEDVKLSKRHLKARIKFNEAHAKDHLKEARDAKKQLREKIYRA